MTTLRTFGYEGLEVDQFIRRLRAAGVRNVVDVRELPLSRKRGFSKKAFAENLADAGIGYSHMPGLGCPKDIRNAYKEDGDWPKYEKAFSAHLATRNADVRDLADIASASASCLICFEADFTRCHRRLVALATAKHRDLDVVHLTIKTAVPETRHR
ncbi:DUF488 family protein [Lysobacter sp. 2RAF19]